jgi:hypothetical protein
MILILFFVITVCADFNLCHTCYASGVIANNQNSSGHHGDHPMISNELPSIEGKLGTKKSSKANSAPLTFDCFSKGSFYATGNQLGVLVCLHLH